MRQSLPIGKSPHVSGNRIPTERDYLRPDEVNRLIIAAGKRGRNPLRDVVLLRLTYRHGLRAKEARLARWSQFDLDNPGTKTFHVQRLKGSEDSTHTLDRDEVAGLRKLREVTDGPFVSSASAVALSAPTRLPGSSARRLKPLGSVSTSIRICFGIAPGTCWQTKD